MTKIPLHDRSGGVVAYALVDAADAATINQWRWCRHRRGYAHRGTKVGGRNKTVLMHRFLLGLEPGDSRVADHINRDKLDNRRSNLRVVDRAGNAQNLDTRRGCKSRFRGVVYTGGKKPWRARVKLNGQFIHLGYCEDEQEAGEAAHVGRKKYLPYSTVESPKREKTTERKTV